MVSLATYKGYRKASRELMNKVMGPALSHDALDRSGKLLGISQRGVLVFDSEEEMTVLFDFALNDYRVRGKNAIELYAETKGPANEMEKQLLAGFASAYTSLFRVISISKADNSVLLRNLLTERNDVTLTDINLSRTAIPGLLLFLRLVPLRDFNMTSGFMFAFPGHLEGRLLAGYKRPVKKPELYGEARSRFVHFFKAHKTHGVEVRYK